MRKSITYLLSTLLLFISLSGLAGDIKTSVYIEKQDIYSGLQLEVEDFSRADELANPSSYEVTRRAKLHLSYTRDNQSDLEHKYWRYEIDYTEITSNTSGTLAIQFNGHDASTQHLYEQLAIFNTNNHLAQVSIDAIRGWSATSPLDETNLPAPNISNPTTSNDIPDDILLTLSIETERYHNFSLTTTVPLFLNNFDAHEGIDIGWGYAIGAEEYDLEWVFIDAQDAGSYTDVFEYKEPTRITTLGNTYRVDPMFPVGTVYFRVRPRGKNYVGEWSYTTNNSSPPIQQVITGFETNKNWQYTISFAEEGKSKKVLNYMDGSMRGKQTITKLSTEDVYVVGVNRYDYEGRASVSILPSAIDKYSADNNYSYKEKMNLAYGTTDMFNKQHFDADIGNLNTNNKKLSGLNGAGQYYSSSNPFTDAINRDYIPDAGGMPYAQTEFMRDGTGRVKRTSGVGVDHALGSDHETFYFYSSPNTTELRRLFGENVGNVNHYKKNYVVDPNGQISASYLDQEGRTIATCLVGEAPDNLDALPGNSQENLTVNLIEANELINDNGIVSRSENTIFNYLPQTYTFDYDLNYGVIANIATSNGTYCENCSYILEIKVLKPDGSLFDLDYTAPGTSTPSPIITQKYTNDLAAVCLDVMYTPSADPISFSFQTIGTDPKGDYTVIKTLRVDEEAMQTALDNELVNIENGNGIIPPLQTLIDQHMGEIDYSNCDVSCYQHARQVLLDGLQQTNPDATDNDVDDKEAEDLAVILCDQDATLGGTATSEPVNNCESLLEAMKDDVSPGGWLFESPWLEEALNELYPNDINYDTRASLIANWLPQLADVLVLEHREYCHYLKCIAVAPSNAFAAELATINNYTDAYNQGYTDPNTNNDPFLSLAGVNSVAFTTLINSTYPDQAGLQQGLVAFTAPNNIATYPGTTQTVSQVLYNGSFDDEKRWQIFQSLYNAERFELIESIYSGCSYYSDDEAIHRDPSAPLVWTEEQDCEELCEANVQNWLTSITNNCGTLSSTNITTIQAHLENYCANSCNGSNPNGLLFEELLASNTDLSDIQTILNDVGCGNDSILEYIAQPNPCLQTATMTIDVLEAELTLAAQDWKKFINDLLIYPITVNSNITINATNFPNSNSLIGNYVTATSIKVMADNSIKFYNGGTLVATNNQFRCTYDDNGNFIELLAFSAIDNLEPNPTYTDGINYTFKFDATWNNNGTNEELTIVSPAGCPNYYPNGIDGFSNVFNGEASVTTVTVNKTVTYCAEWDASYNDNNTLDFNLDSVSEWCNEELEELAILAAEQEHQELVDAFIEDYWAAANEQCMQSPLDEYFKYNYILKEYQYTLFYFDQAGSLVQTVPPEGVHPSTSFDNEGNWIGTSPPSDPNHNLKTTYQYNSLGQLISQETPDAGISNFYYNDNQQLRFSQNAQQLIDGNYSYTKYDEHGRTIEAGQVSLAQIPTTEQLNDNTYPTVGLEQVTASYYDESNHTVANFVSENARGRIASVAYNEDGAPTSTDFNHATHYSYDIHGNVKELVQENKNIKFEEQQLKRMTYDYDLISGNVNEVIYQEGELDEFRHRYSYDADNRLTKAETSKDGEIWKTDAKYFYYLHGPLARVELGHDKVAANDFAYTIQGWLKGVNSTTVQATKDIGKDGNNESTNQNRFVGQDAFGFTLGYFSGDYQSIGTTDFLASNTSTISPAINDLFNGNISHMTTGMKDENENLIDIHGNQYRYDQLNRIKSMKVYNDNTGLITNNSWSGATRQNVVNGMGDYETHYEYDKNGNLKTLIRKTEKETSNGNTNYLDHFKYNYYEANGVEQNRLKSVEDLYDATYDYGDIKSGQIDQNYVYNAIGQLTEDNQENIIEIEWMVNGKVKAIRRNNVVGLNDVEFFYDAMGNRIGKLVKPRDNQGNLKGELDWTYNHYVLDASGNTMAVYKQNYATNNNPTYLFKTEFTLEEHPVYGSSRLGVQNINKKVFSSQFASGYINQVFNENLQSGIVNNINLATMNHLKYIPGEKSYELSNHLGNVLAVVTDKKVGIESTTISGDLAYYQSDVISYSDYYPFGMLQPNRHGQENGTNYKYNFQGQETDDEVKGKGNSVNYKYRMHDPRLGRFFATDPLEAKFPFYSPYHFSSNSPIVAVELEGLESSVRLNYTEGSVNITRDEKGRLALHYHQLKRVRELSGSQYNVGLKTGSEDFENDFKAGGVMSVYCKNCGTYARTGAWAKIALPSEPVIKKVDFVYVNWNARFIPGTPGTPGTSGTRGTSPGVSTQNFVNPGLFLNDIATKQPIPRSGLDYSAANLQALSQPIINSVTNDIASLPANATINYMQVTFVNGVNNGFKNQVITDFKNNFKGVQLYIISQNNSDNSYLINNVIINYSVPTPGTPGTSGTPGTPGTSSQLRLNPTLERESKSRTLEIKPVEIRF